MEFIFLGTAGMQPTKNRGLFSILLRHKSENILIDCGEGTQRQMRIAKLSPTKITKIFITHLHGDHVNGLPGLLQNLQANQYTKVLEIYGPKGLKNLMRHILNIARVNIKIKIIEIKEGIFYKDINFKVEARKLDHSCLCYGYIITENDKRKINLKYTKKFGLTKSPLLGDLQKGKDIKYKNKKIKVKDATILIKGKKVSIITDTIYFNNLIKIVKDSDMLIIESTFGKDLQQNAKDFKHLSTEDVGNLAKKAKVKKVVITHFSQRYKDVKYLEKEVKKYIKNVVAAEDFMKIKI
ncbi:ribonuclease Z [archaeon]|nr:ribonuclease Z [archaeon]